MIFIKWIAAFIIGSIPIIFWLIIFSLIFKKVHKRAVPLRRLSEFLGMGMLITFPTFWLEYFYLKFFRFLGVDLKSDLTLINIVLWCGGVALIEEFSKFFGAYFQLKTSGGFERAVDAVICSVVLSLGFGLMENVGVIKDMLIVAPRTDMNDQLLSALGTMIWRTGSANLVHALCSGVVGFFWALQLISAKRYYLCIGVSLGALLHGIYNILFMLAGSKSQLFLLVFGVYLSTIVLFELLRKFKSLLCNLII